MNNPEQWDGQLLYNATDLSRAACSWGRYYTKQVLILQEAGELNQLIDYHRKIDKKFYEDCLKSWKNKYTREEQYDWKEKEVKIYPSDVYTPVYGALEMADKTLSYLIDLLTIMKNNDLDCISFDLYLKEYKTIRSRYARIVKKYGTKAPIVV